MIQTAGRAARHIGGECVLFCDKITDSIQALIDITSYRRERQQAHNEKYGITPMSVKRAIQSSLHTHENAEKAEASKVAEDTPIYDKERIISELEAEMREASSRLEFELAGHLRDQIIALKAEPANYNRQRVEYPKVRRGGGRKKGKV